ncbi:MAG: hypothetical protein DMF90_21955 [Acidobacteria bacterium]|nr:MAG: hypothetical protein DMF90_21955 [Acidobacteriota bacterium]
MDRPHLVRRRGTRAAAVGRVARRGTVVGPCGDDGVPHRGQPAAAATHAGIRLVRRCVAIARPGTGGAPRAAAGGEGAPASGAGLRRSQCRRSVCRRFHELLHNSCVLFSICNFNVSGDDLSIVGLHMILITGGMGFVGRNAAKALLDHGEDVVLTTSRVGADPSFLAPHVGKRVFIERLDALDAPNLIETGRRHGVTGIVHLAGGPMHGPLLKGLRDNVHGFLDVLEAGSSLGVKRITVASSIAIYAGVEDQVWREDAPLPMASPYPMTAYKKVFEIYGDYYSRQSKLSLASLRFGAYGPLSRSQYTLPARLVHAAMKGVTGPELRPGEAPPYEDDACDLCYVADLGDAFARVQLAPTLNHSIYTRACRIVR